MEGKTVLYVPSEGQKVDPEIASRDKELVQRLESKRISQINSQCMTLPPPQSSYSEIEFPLLHSNVDKKFICIQFMSDNS